MNHKELHGETIKESFDRFHEQNPQVYEAFKEQVKIALKAGKKKMSAKAIINFLRWSMFLETTDDTCEFKINDSYSAHFARLFVERNPRFDGIFEMRNLRS